MHYFRNCSRNPAPHLFDVLNFQRRKCITVYVYLFLHSVKRFSKFQMFRKSCGARIFNLEMFDLPIVPSTRASLLTLLALIFVTAASLAEVKLFFTYNLNVTSLSKLVEFFRIAQNVDLKFFSSFFIKIGSHWVYPAVIQLLFGDKFCEVAWTVHVILLRKA